MPGGLDGLLVYSDPGVGQTSATTDPDRIARFLHQRTGRVRLVAGTYHSAARIAEAYTLNPGLPPFDVMVLDEAHRTAGNGSPGGFAAVLDDAQIPATTRLSLTATARVHVDEDGTQDAVSMDDQELYGPRVYELTFGDAINRGLLADFRVAVVLVTDIDVHRVLQVQASQPWGRDLTTSQVAVQIAVGRAIEEYGLRRLVAFHGRVERSSAFTKALPRTAAAVTTVPVDTLHVAGTTPQGARRDALEQLANPAPGRATVLSNVSVLIEGVDVPAVDSVVFADPKTSKIAIAQAVGRALRLHSEKDRPSVIVLPVYLAPGESPEQVLAASEFRHVWTVLTSLRDYDERLDAEFSTARIRRGEQGPDKSVDLPKAIDLLGTDPILQEKLHNALKTHLLRNTTESWLEKFGALKAYAEFTGEIPKNTYVTPSGVPLGRFCTDQKTAHRKGTLQPERARMLESLPGWDWGKKRAAISPLTEEAVVKLAQEWTVLTRLNVNEQAPCMREMAYRCHELIPGFEFPYSKHRAWVGNAVSQMAGVHSRYERAKNGAQRST